MVDVSGKDVTARTASASGRVLVSPTVVALRAVTSLADTSTIRA